MRILICTVAAIVSASGAALFAIGALLAMQPIDALAFGIVGAAGIIAGTLALLKTV
jgi:hypothetical protein